jgi:diacylglycerol kinase family enzyme
MSTPWVAIQRNPRSGTGARRRELLQLVAGLKKHRLRARVFSNREKMDARLRDPGRRDSLVCVVAAGGDGTICDVINRVPGIPLAILPMGTENLVAKYLGIPPCGRTVAEFIAAGQFRSLDLCRCGDRHFLLMVSLGFDAEIVRLLHESRRGNITKLTYFQPTWQSLRKYRHPQMRVYIDGQPQPILARLAIVANLPVYAFGLKMVGSAEGDDGWLDARMFQLGSAFQMFRYLYKVVARGHERLPDVVSARGRRIRIESDVPVPVQADGDPAGFTPVDISIEPAAVRVIVPPEPGWRRSVECPDGAS